jgi:hypothetical protein
MLNDFKKIVFVVFLFYNILFSQDIFNDEYYDISSYLKDIENGELQNIKSELPKLLKEYPKDPNILYLDALLTTDGDLALNKFLKIPQDYPSSKYADAALFRVFCYYFAIEDYEKSNNIYNWFKKDYPNSPYFKQCRFINLTNTKKKQTLEKTDDNKYRYQETKEYNIQLGAFSNRENAEKLYTNLISQGYKINKIEKNNLLVLILNINLKDDNELDALIQNLSKKYNLQPKLLK